MCRCIECDCDFDRNYDFKDDSIKNVINKVRNVVKIFRKSPKMNGILMVKVKEKLGQEKHVILDVKTKC